MQTSIEYWALSWVWDYSSHLDNQGELFHTTVLVYIRHPVYIELILSLSSPVDFYLDSIGGRSIDSFDVRTESEIQYSMEMSKFAPSPSDFFGR